MSFQYRGLKGEYEKHVVSELEVEHRLKMMAQQNQNNAPPAPKAEEAQPDLAAMMAELQALRAQVASQTKQEEDNNAQENGGC